MATIALELRPGFSGNGNTVLPMPCGFFATVVSVRCLDGTSVEARVLIDNMPAQRFFQHWKHFAEPRCSLDHIIRDAMDACEDP